MVSFLTCWSLSHFAKYSRSFEDTTDRAANQQAELLGEKHPCNLAQRWLCLTLQVQNGRSKEGDAESKAEENTPVGQSVMGIPFEQSQDPIIHKHFACSKEWWAAERDYQGVFWSQQVTAALCRFTAASLSSLRFLVSFKALSSLLCGWFNRKVCPRVNVWSGDSTNNNTTIWIMSIISDWVGAMVKCYPKFSICVSQQMCYIYYILHAKSVIVNIVLVNMNIVCNIQ